MGCLKGGKNRPEALGLGRVGGVKGRGSGERQQYVASSAKPPRTSQTRAQRVRGRELQRLTLLSKKKYRMPMSNQKPGVPADQRRRALLRMKPSSACSEAPRVVATPGSAPASGSLRQRGKVTATGSPTITAHVGRVWGYANSTCRKVVCGSGVLPRWQVCRRQGNVTPRMHPQHGCSALPSKPAGHLW